jgi:hypothetical protein
VYFYAAGIHPIDKDVNHPPFNWIKIPSFVMSPILPIGFRRAYAPKQRNIEDFSVSSSIEWLADSEIDTIFNIVPHHIGKINCKL